MKKVWEIVKYFFLVISIIGIILCIYKKELYLVLKGFLLLIFWISMILEDSPINKNKIVTKTSLGSIVVFISLSILEMFGA